MESVEVKHNDCEPTIIATDEDTKAEASSQEKETEKSKEEVSEKSEKELVVNGESGAVSLEATCESPMDDLNSEGGSEGGVSTDEGIVASDEDDKEEKSDFEKVDKAKKSQEVDQTGLISES